MHPMMRTIGEVFNVTDAQLEEFIGEHGYFSSMFDFRETLEGKSVLGWYDCKQPTPEEYKKCCFESQKQSEKIGYLSNIIENHDEPRGVSHYLPETALMKTAAQVQDRRQQAQSSSRQVQSSSQNERGKKLLSGHLNCRCSTILFSVPITYSLFVPFSA